MREKTEVGGGGVEGMRAKKRGKRCTRKREIGKEKKNRVKERPGNDSGIGHGNVQQQCV